MHGHIIIQKKFCNIHIQWAHMPATDKLHTLKEILNCLNINVYKELKI